MSILFTILTLYSWVLGAGLVLFLLLIARFYEKNTPSCIRMPPSGEHIISFSRFR